MYWDSLPKLGGYAHHHDSRLLQTSSAPSRKTVLGAKGQFSRLARRLLTRLAVDEPDMPQGSIIHRGAGPEKAQSPCKLLDSEPVDILDDCTFRIAAIRGI